MRHGGDIGEAIARHGGDRAEWLDLSTGISPYPYAPPAPDPAHLMRLPQAGEIAALEDAARRFYRVPPGTGLSAAPGSEILIRLLPQLVPGPAALLTTSYGSYSESFGPNLRAVGNPGELRERESLILVRPNNPDGQIAPRKDLQPVIKKVERSGGIIIVDEAYADADPRTSLVPETSCAPVLVLKSFGKFFGLPGLRLGFAIGAPDLVARLRTRLGDWPVSGPALSAGIAALGDERWQSEVRRKLAAQRERLDEMLRKAGYRPAGDTPLFAFLADCPADRLHAHLARHRIWTRVFADRPSAVRIGLPGDDDGLERLQEALAAFDPC